MSIQRANLINMDEDSLIEAIRKDFGLAIRDVEKVTRGYSSQVFQANYNGKVIFIRINDDLRVYPAEIVGYQIFKYKNIPIPEIIAYKENPKTIGYPTMIMYSARGIEFNKAQLSLEERYRVYEDVGKILKIIHETKLEGYGLVKAENQKLVGTFPSWKDYWESRRNTFKEEIDYLEHNELLNKAEIEKLIESHEEIISLDFGMASLLHRDMHSVHIFVEGDKVSGIIDLGRLSAGDPRYDIAMCLVFQNEREAQSFKKGYGDLSNDPIITKYILLIAGTKIAFRHKRGLMDGVEKMKAVFRETISKL